MKRSFLIIFVTAICFSESDAQVGNYVGFSYSLGFPAPDLRDYINNVSGRGLYIEYHYNISPGVFIGLSSGWNVFEDSENDRRTDSFPIFLNVNYLYETDVVIRPYVGFGAGALYIERDTDIEATTQETEDLQFALKPELGAILRFTESTGIKFATKYYQAFKSPDLDSQSYLTFDIGIIFLADY